MQDISRAERFLRQYRKLEGMLEKRYAGHKLTSGSVVIEYLRDPDSAPCRTELDLCREIRNLLSHNADGNGEPVVEPSEAMLRMLDDILGHVQHPRMAVDFGTTREKILFAHPNDCAVEMMRRMRRLGYSHVPVCDKTGLVGVFSASSLAFYIADRGFDSLHDALRIGELKNALDLTDERSEKYRFMPTDATLLAVRDAFERRDARNSRLSVVFITEDGTRDGEIVAMLTPWDVLREEPQ